MTKISNYLISFLSLAFIAIAIAIFVLILQYFNSNKKDANLDLIYNLTLSWFVLIWTIGIVAFIFILIALPIIKSTNSILKYLGYVFLLIGFLIAILGSVTIFGLMVATIIEIKQGSHASDLMIPYILLIVAVILLGVIGFYQGTKRIKESNEQYF